jgi:DNA-binding NtrC family response regulator
MKAHMMKQFLLIGAPSHPWRKILQKAVKPRGELDVFDATQSYLKGYKKAYDLVIIDATAIDHAEEWVARLRSQLPSSRIIVLTAKPTWEQAREALLAGAMDYNVKSNDKDKLSKLLSDLLDKPVV